MGFQACLFVVRDAKVVFLSRTTAASTRGDTQDIFSASKSIASTLVGIAQDDSDLGSVTARVEVVPQWKGTAAQAVTVTIC